MRSIPTLLALAAALAGAGAARADPPAPPSPAATWYPPAALAAKLGGQATLSCAHDEHAALKDCTLVSETPAGQGFGAAALAMAAASRGNPKISITDPGFLGASPLTLTFTPDPPAIHPDVTRLPHAVTQPGVIAPPSDDVMQSTYPPQALKDHVAGKVALACRVTAQGRLADCSVLDEAPAGQGFGDAALKLAPQFQMQPMLRDGDPTDDGHIVLPISFGPH
jgi:TonB family protein